jgi:hypothetical protein
MAIKSLHTRFLLSGCLIVLTTVACSALAAWTLYRMSRGIHEALLDSQRTIEALATLTRALEREDDAVLLAISGRFAAARDELGRQRAEFDHALERLQPHLTEPSERALAERFARDVAALRQLGDRIVSASTTLTAASLSSADSASGMGPGTQSAQTTKPTITSKGREAAMKTIHRRIVSKVRRSFSGASGVGSICVVIGFPSLD